MIWINLDNDFETYCKPSMIELIDFFEQFCHFVEIYRTKVDFRLKNWLPVNKNALCEARTHDLQIMRLTR